MLQLKSVTSQDIELRSNDEVVIINQGFLKYYLENYLREGDKIKHVRRIKIVRKLLKDHAEEHRVPLQYSSEAGIEITCRKIRKIFDFKIELYRSLIDNSNAVFRETVYVNGSLLVSALKHIIARSEYHILPDDELRIQTIDKILTRSGYEFSENNQIGVAWNLID